MGNPLKLAITTIGDLLLNSMFSRDADGKPISDIKGPINGQAKMPFNCWMILLKQKTRTKKPTELARLFFTKMKKDLFIIS